MLVLAQILYKSVFCHSTFGCNIPASRYLHEKVVATVMGTAKTKLRVLCLCHEPICKDRARRGETPKTTTVTCYIHPILRNDTAKKKTFYFSLTGRRCQEETSDLHPRLMLIKTKKLKENFSCTRDARFYLHIRINKATNEFS